MKYFDAGKTPVLIIKLIKTSLMRTVFSIAFLISFFSLRAQNSETFNFTGQVQHNDIFALKMNKNFGIQL